MKDKELKGCETGVKITGQGEHHLTAILGTEQFQDQFIKNKVEGWLKDFKLPFTYAKDNPQAAHSALTKSICSIVDLFPISYAKLK